MNKKVDDNLQATSQEIDSSSTNLDLHDEISYDKMWFRVPHLLKLNLLLLVPITAGTLSGFDCYIINSLQIMDHWNKSMGNPSEPALGALTSGPPIGFLLTFTLGRFMSDKYGRKPTSVIGAILFFIGVLIQSFGPNYASFLTARVILGAAMGFYLISAPAWIAELSLSQHRPICVTLFNISTFLGSLLTTIVSYGTLGMNNTYQWRIPCLSQLIIALPHLIFVWYVPESPRYLVYMNKESEAREILMKYHGGNDEAFASKAIDGELSQIRAALDLEKLADEASFKIFFTKKGNFQRFCICIFMGFMQYNVGFYSISFYVNSVLDISGITSPTSKMLVATLISATNFLCAFIPLFLLEKIGRRKLFLYSLVSIGVIYVSFITLSAVNSEKYSNLNKSLANGILAMVFCCTVVYSIGFSGTLYLYVTEILSYSLRSRGLVLFVLSSQTFSILNAFITPVGINAIEWRFHIIYISCILFCISFVYFLFPETKGHSLESSGQIINSKEPIVEEVNHSRTA